MAVRDTLLRAVRWPVVLILVAGAGVGAAFLLDLSSSLSIREFSLTIGAPSLLLLAGGVLWLLGAVIRFAWRRHRGKSAAG